MYLCRNKCQTTFNGLDTDYCISENKPDKRITVHGTKWTSFLSRTYCYLPEQLIIDLMGDSPLKPGEGPIEITIEISVRSL